VVDRPVGEAYKAGAADDITERHRNQIVDDASDGDLKRLLAYSTDSTNFVSSRAVDWPFRLG